MFSNLVNKYNKKRPLGHRLAFGWCFNQPGLISAPYFEVGNSAYRDLSPQRPKLSCEDIASRDIF